jgi:2-iminoacetate synthase ThiH
MANEKKPIANDKVQLIAVHAIALNPRLPMVQPNEAFDATQSDADYLLACGAAKLTEAKPAEAVKPNTDAGGNV